MTYPPHQPENWSDPAYPAYPPQPTSGQPGYPPQPTSGQPGYPPIADPAAGYPPVDPGGYKDPNLGGYPPVSDPGYAAGYPAAPGYPPAGYPGAGYPPAWGAPRKTNGMAIASLIVSIISAVGLTCYGFGGLAGAIGAILGHIGRKQAKERGEDGDGIALAGIIVGWIAFGIGLIIIALVVIGVAVLWNTTPDSTGYGDDYY